MAADGSTEPLAGSVFEYPFCVGNRDYVQGEYASGLGPKDAVCVLGVCLALD
jgi:hypothetical protein